MNADRHLTLEELSYAGDLLASQERALKNAEAQVRSLQSLCSEVSHLGSQSKQTSS